MDESSNRHKAESVGVDLGLNCIEAWQRARERSCKYVNYFISKAGVRETPPHDKQMEQRLKKQ